MIWFPRLGRLPYSAAFTWRKLTPPKRVTRTGWRSNLPWWGTPLNMWTQSRKKEIVWIDWLHQKGEGPQTPTSMWAGPNNILVYLNGNNAAEGENNITEYANSYPMNWTVKNWFVTILQKGHGHDTDEWRDYDEDNVPFSGLKRCMFPMKTL